MPPQRHSSSRDCFRLLANGRAWNIALRTGHVAAMGVLLGGHAFDVPRERLLLSLWLTIATGVGLGVLEARPGLLWFHQGRGLMTLGKLLLIGAVPFLWSVRLPILLAVVVIASVGAHMPARFRYYSVLYRKIVPCGSGPGVWRLGNEAESAAGCENPIDSQRVS